LIGCKPSNAVVVEAPAGVSLTDAICAPAATVGGEGVTLWRSRWRRERRVALPASVVLLVAGSVPSQDRV
jgi:hypothetical protein